MRHILGVYSAHGPHWVGGGLPVRLLSLNKSHGGIGLRSCGSPLLAAVRLSRLKREARRPARPGTGHSTRELIHELSSDNVRQNVAAATFREGCFWGYLKRTEVKNP
jgi:hypothetical protein